MKLLRRLLGILFAPTRTWQEIAAQRDGLGFVTCVYLPVVMLASGALSVAAARLPITVAPQVTQHYRRGPDGSMQLVATSTPLPVSGFFGTDVLLALFVMLGVLGMLTIKIMTADNAPRFGATADGDAATRVAVYASTPAWLAVPLALLPVYGQTLAFGMIGYAIYQVYLGAPTLLPGDPALRDRFGTAMALRAFFVGIALVVLLLILLLLIGIERLGKAG
jgi:hypothetical protein